MIFSHIFELRFRALKNTVSLCLKGKVHCEQISALEVFYVSSVLLLLFSL